MQTPRSVAIVAKGSGVEHPPLVEDTLVETGEGLDELIDGTLTATVFREVEVCRSPGGSHPPETQLPPPIAANGSGVKHDDESETGTVVTDWTGAATGAGDGSGLEDGAGLGAGVAEVAADGAGAGVVTGTDTTNTPGGNQPPL